MKSSPLKRPEEGGITVPNSLLTADLAPGAKVLWIVLAGYHQRNDPRPSLSQLCQDLWVGTSALRNYRRELLAKGWLKIQQCRDGGRWVSNNYELLIPAPGPVPRPKRRPLLEDDDIELR